MNATNADSDIRLLRDAWHSITTALTVEPRWTKKENSMKITLQINGEPKECAMLLDALDKIGEEAQKRQLKMSTVTNPCKVETVPTNGPTLMHGVTTGTPLPPQGITETCVKESDPE